MTSLFHLQDAFKGFTGDQDKLISPVETVRRLKERLGRIDLDILAATERIDTGRLGIPVFFSRCGEDALALTGTRKQMGKGATPEQAEASAVMELAERFSLFSFSGAPANFTVDIPANLKEQTIISHDMIARSVHDDSKDLGAAFSIFDQLPMRWTQGYNLTRREPVLVPFDWFFTINEFNGSSAGNCREEALLQGVCEIVERHVSSIISRDRCLCPAIDPDSATDPVVLEMTRKYRQAGIRFHLSDFTLDMGIPTVGMLAWDPATFPHLSEIVWTAGTTPSPEKALSRAMTEVAQLAGDFNRCTNYVASGLPKPAGPDAVPFITAPGQTVGIQDLPDLSDSNIRVEIENCVAALAARDMDVIAIDVTHPQLSVPAVYTLVPGAHFRERAAGTSVGMFTAKLITEKFSPADAIARLKSFNHALPRKHYIQFYLGTSHLAQNDFNAALDHFRRALQFEPPAEDIPSIYVYIGTCLKEKGQYREAIDALAEGEKFDTERPELYNLMGFCHFKRQNHNAAIDCFNKALALNPGSAIDYANIAVNCRKLGRTDEAIEYFETALDLDPSIAFARTGLTELKKPGTC